MAKLDQIKSLTKLFVVLKEYNKTVRYGDLLRAGIRVDILDMLVEDYRLKVSKDIQGYTIISF